MKITPIIDNFFRSVDAINYANKNRKLVRQLETGKRNILLLSPKTIDRYERTVGNSGNYSKSTIKRAIAFIKNWNAIRKDKSTNFLA